VSQSRKLFLATILLAVGYGVAHLLGSPNAPYLPRSPQAGPATPQVVTARLPVNDPRANPNLVGSARLLPDHASSEPAKDAQAKPAVSAAPVAKAHEPPQLIAPVVDATSITSAAPAEDPYSVPQSNLASRQLPPVAPVLEKPILEIQPPANALATIVPIPDEQTAKASTIANDWKPAGASQVAFNSPAVSPMVEQQSTVAPPPWPVESVTMRTHIIVDGDSLAKLAGRYLDDPQRSNEIFTLNRNILTSPELLPIGAEIRIPARQGMQGGGDGTHFAPPTAMSVTAAGQRGMVPISPVPTMSADVPRAHLLGPRPVESPRAATQSPGY
jgi:nucleoid-associated protein YgaU